jgi:hypothetical protein
METNSLPRFVKAKITNIPETQMKIRAIATVAVWFFTGIATILLVSSASRWFRFLLFLPVFTSFQLAFQQKFGVCVFSARGNKMDQCRVSQIAWQVVLTTLAKSTISAFLIVGVIMALPEFDKF